MCLPKAAFSSFGCSRHFSDDSALVSDTLVLSSRIGNMPVLKLLVVLGTCLFLSYSCIVRNTLLPELSGCYWNMLVLKAVVILGTCLFLSYLVVIVNMLVLYSCIIGNMLVPEQSGRYLEHACS